MCIRDRYDRFIGDTLGKRNIAEIKYSDVVQFYNHLTKKQELRWLMTTFPVSYTHLDVYKRQLLPFETSIPTALYILRTSKSEFAWIPAFLSAYSISWGIKRTWSSSSTCINRTAAMTGWLTGFRTDANGPRTVSYTHLRRDIEELLMNLYFC